MRRSSETWIDSPVREAAVSAVVLFGVVTVLARLTDGEWSLVRPLVFAIAVAAGGPISQVFTSARTRARVAERRAREPVVKRLGRERGLLIVLLVVTVLALVTGAVLIRQDLGAGRAIGANAGVALGLLAISAVFLATSISRRRTVLTSMNGSDTSAAGAT